MNMSLLHVSDERVNSLARIVYDKHFELDPKLDVEYDDRRKRLMYEDILYNLSYLDTAMKFNDDKIFSDYAGMLKDARRIFGDLPIADLTQNAERLIGTSLREMGSVSAMRNRMANIQATSAAFGLNPAAVAERMMQVTDAVQGGMYSKSMQDVRMQNDPHLQAVTATAFGRIASDISEQAVLGGLRAGHSNAAASNLYAQQGKYMPVMEANQITQMLAQGAVEVLSDRDIGFTDNAIAAQAMLSSGRIKDPAARAKAQALITAGSEPLSIEYDLEPVPAFVVVIRTEISPLV